MSRRSSSNCSGRGPGAGVRTPWTLASEEVWLRTHRLAGRTFVLAGIAVVATAVFNVAAFVEFGMLALAAAIPVVYSYVLYRRLEGFNGGGSNTL